MTKSEPASMAFDKIEIFTNGGLRSNKFVKDVLKNPKVHFIFGIDGITDEINQKYRKGVNTKLALSYTFLKILEKYPDSHLRRKYGNKIAKKTSNEASDLIKILDGDTRYESWGKNLISLDKHFKMARVNPGTTADLLVVSMMIYDYFIGFNDH